MSSPNGQSKEEPVAYADVLEYWRDLVVDLHSQLSVARAKIMNRDRMIEHLQGKLREPGMAPSENDKAETGG